MVLHCPLIEADIWYPAGAVFEAIVAHSSYPQQ